MHSVCCAKVSGISRIILCQTGAAPHSDVGRPVGLAVALA